MKIVAVSDVHGAYRRLLGIIATEKPFEVLLVAGDLTTIGTPDEAETALRSFIAPEYVTLGVAGNMDPPELEEVFVRLGISLNGRGTTVGEAGFFGVSGSPPTPMATPYEIPEEEILRRANEGWDGVRGARFRIFVPHAPPGDTDVDLLRSGLHVGSKGVREFIDRVHPDVVVCGHIHEAHGITELGETKVVNCGPAGNGHYAVITLGDGNVVVEKKKF